MQHLAPGGHKLVNLGGRISAVQWAPSPKGWAAPQGESQQRFRLAEVGPAEGIPLQLLTCLWGVRGAIEEFPLGPGNALGMG